MKASELIVKLQKSIEEEGDLDISVWADHGQYTMEADQVDVVYTLEPDEYMMEAATLDNYDEEDREDYISDGTRFIQIS